MDGKKPNFGNISEFLKKIRNFTPSDLHTKKVITQKIKEVIGVEVLKADLSIQGTRVFISCSPILKQELKLNQEKLLEAINRELVNKKIVELR